MHDMFSEQNQSSALIPDVEFDSIKSNIKDTPIDLDLERSEIR